MIDAINTVVSLIAVCGIPFLLGMIAGIEIVKRRKETEREADAELGRTVGAIFDDMERDFLFTGSGMKFTRIGSFKRGGVECRIVLEAEA